MTVLVIIVLGLCFGSFVNALVWRLHEESKVQSPKLKAGKGKKAKESQLKALEARKLSILRGRSMCVDCGHQLAWYDLLPIVSWVSLGGKCRYCNKTISVHYPIVEAMAALAFALSYLFWPYGFSGAGLSGFIIWLPILTLLIALLVYDLRWTILPDRLTYMVLALALLQVIITVFFYGGGMIVIRDSLFGLLCLGGLFYALFQMSGGRWIGGGDVKLGFGLGILAGNVPKALLLLFLSAAIGSVVSVLLILIHKASRNAQVPFGPFLVVAAVIVQLFGSSIINWYQTVLLFPS